MKILKRPYSSIDYNQISVDIFIYTRNFLSSLSKVYWKSLQKAVMTN